MIGKVRMGLAALVVAVAAMGVLTGCDEIAATFGYVPEENVVVVVSTVTGSVTDARLSTGAAMAGVSVSLFASGGTTALATVTTATDGAFSFSDVGPGLYKVTATKTGYAFIDKSFGVSEINATVNIGAVLGFSSTGNKISLIVVWSSAFNDVDSYLTIPTGDLWSGATPTLSYPLTPLLADPYIMPTSVIGLGFLPDTTDSALRESINWTSRSSTVLVSAYSGTGTTSAVTLDRDVTTGSGPETITIHELPLAALASGLAYNITGNPAVNGLPTDASYNYAWVGVAEYYLKAYGTPTLATEGASGGASAEVYVVQGSSIKGRFAVPDYMTIDMASVVRINMFVRQTLTGDVPVYQFLPDIRIADYAGIRSAADVANRPLVLFGNAR